MVMFISIISCLVPHARSYERMYTYLPLVKGLYFSFPVTLERQLNKKKKKQV